MKHPCLKFLALLFGIATTAVVSSTALAQPALPQGDAKSAGMSSARLAILDAGIQAEIDKGTVAGVVVAVARHGHVVHNKAYGYADLATRKPMRTDNLFRLYSMTKAVASVALLSLYEQGKFQLNDPLELYIPSFKNLKVYAGKDANGNVLLEDRKSTRLNSSHSDRSRMPSSA